MRPGNIAARALDSKSWCRVETHGQVEAAVPTDKGWAQFERFSHKPARLFCSKDIIIIIIIIIIASSIDKTVVTTLTFPRRL